MQGAHEMTFQISPHVRLSSVTKCPLHHTNVPIRGTYEMTFQISPRIYLVWPSVPLTTPKFSHEVDVRWLFKCHLASMWDDIWKVYKGKVLMWGAREMTFQISPCIHLAWPSTPKFSREVDTRWLFKCHLTSTQDDIRKVYKEKFLQIFLIWSWDMEEVTSNSKVLMRGACKMTFQISPHIHLVWPSVPSTTKVLMWGACEMTFKSHLTSI